MVNVVLRSSNKETVEDLLHLLRKRFRTVNGKFTYFKYSIEEGKWNVTSDSEYITSLKEFYKKQIIHSIEVLRIATATARTEEEIDNLNKLKKRCYTLLQLISDLPLKTLE